MMTVNMMFCCKTYRYLRTLLVYDYNDGKRYVFTNTPKSMPGKRTGWKSLRYFRREFGERFVRQVITYSDTGYGLVILERIPFGYL